MKKLSKLRSDENGAAMIEMAFALPIFLMLIWMVVQLGLIYRANAGIQNALGEGARFATLFPTPSDPDIVAKMQATVDGIGPGNFTPTLTANNTEKYRDLVVTYTQATNLIMIPGPTIKITKRKRVWVAS
jgi:Flp pilus assembly protein TadG